MEVVGARDPGLEDVRRLRAGLRGSMTAVEQALAAAAPGRSAAWAERVEDALTDLAADVREHVAATEGAGGLHAALLAAAPRLSSSVQRLVTEHATIDGLVGDLLTRLRRPVAEEDVGAVRDLGIVLLNRVARHRQRGADLIYQAYQVDLGGET